MIDAMKQALEALDLSQSLLERSQHHAQILGAYTALRQAIEQAEKQEPDLPPVFIGVDVTLKGTQVNAFYRRPNDVAEMFYSEFHPLAKPEQEPVAWIQEDRIVPELGYDCTMTREHPKELGYAPVYTAPPKREQEIFIGTDLTADGMHLVIRRGNEIIHSQFYEAPKREWVGLTDDDVKNLWSTWVGTDRPNYSFAHAIEAKLKERNT